MAENASKIPEESKPQTRPDLDSLRERENPSTSSTSSTGGGSTQGTNVGTGGSTQSTSAGGGGSTSGAGGGLYNPGKLKSAEENGGESDDDNGGGLWNGPTSNNTGDANSKKKKRLQITRKKAATGGAILVLFGAAGFGGMSIMQGPMQLVHLSQILQTNMFGSEESSSKRLQGLWRFARSGSYGETRVGKLSSVVFQKTDARLKGIGVDIVRGGIDQPARVNFDLSKLEKQYPELKGMTDSQAKVWMAEKIGVDASEFRRYGGTGPGGSKFSLNTRKNSIKVNRMINTNAVNLLDNGKAISWMNARSVNTYTGLPSLAHPLKRIAAKQEIRLANRVDASRAAARKAELERARSRAIPETSKVAAAKAKIKGKISSNGGKIGGALLLSAAMCIVRDTSDAIVTVNRASIVMPSVVESADKTAVGSQVQSNQDIDMTSAGNVVKSFTDVNGKTIWNSKELQATANPSQSSKGTELPRDYQQAFNKDTTAANMNETLGGGIVGEIACSPFGQATQIGLAILAVLATPVTGGMSAAVLAGKTAAGVAASAAVIALLQNQFVDLLKNDAIVPEVFSGPIGGGLLAYGGREMANISARSMGGVELSDTESAQIDVRQQIASKNELKKKPLYARIFDVNDYRTPAASAVRSIDPDPAKNVASLLGGILNLPKYFSNSLSAFMPSAKAADKPYNWGFNRYGIPAELLNDPQYENPYKNAEQVGKLLDSAEGDDLRNKAKACFGNEVSKGSDGWQVVPIANTDVNPNENDYREAKCDDLGDANWKRMILFVMDSRTMDATDCYLGETSISEQSCANVGAGGAPSDGGTGTDATITDGTVIELAKKLKQYKEDGKYTCDNPVDCQDIDLMADGKSISCGSTPCQGQTACVAQALDKKILQMTIYLIDKGYKIGTYAFCRAHSRTTGVHHLGRSMDISSINGKKLNSASSKSLALEVDKIIFEIKGEIAPKQIITGGVGYVRSSEFVKYNRQAPGNEGTSAVNAFGPGVMQGHTDHIHVGY